MSRDTSTERETPLALIQLQKTTLGFGGPLVLDEVDLVIERGERLALLGRNGAGKSTLLQVLLGRHELDGGQVIRDAGLKVAALEQYVPEDLEGTVLDLVLEGSQADPHEGEAAVLRVGLDASARVQDLSAGLKRRALLAKALVEDPDILLLDEPTNHLDIESIQWLEGFLKRHVKTLLFVTHDRAFLRAMATGILDIDRGRVTRFGPDYDSYVDRKEHAFEVEHKTHREFDKKLAQEEVWIRQGVRERRKRNQGRVKSLMDMRGERQERRDKTGTVRMEAAAAGLSGRLVVRTKGLSYAWGDQQIVKDLDTEIERGERIGIIGPNGSGKTTLIRLLLGEIEPDAGDVQLGTNLEIAYFDQLHATLDETKSAADNVSDGTRMLNIGGKERSVISYLGDFLFTADQARGSIAKFSGGERNRLLLARLFARPSNLLVLDEPTNDLDIETLEVLEDLLFQYEGTILVVSHDRELLDHIATRSLVIGEGGEVKSFAGGYSDWLTQSGTKKSTSKAPKKKGKQKKAPKAPTLSKDERKELRDLPARIERLESEQAALHEKMADPAFFKGSGDEIAAAQSRLQAIDTEVTTAYERWEALESKRTDA